MKNFSLSFVFILTLLTTGNVFSQDDPWSLIGENDKYKVFLNKDSIKNIGESKTDYDIWIKLECKTECNDGYKSISYSIQNWNLFCERNEYNVPKFTDYYTDGDQSTFSNDTPSAVMENSPGEKLFNYFCKKQE